MWVLPRSAEAPLDVRSHFNWNIGFFSVATFLGLTRSEFVKTRPLVTSSDLGSRLAPVAENLKPACEKQTLLALVEQKRRYH